MRELIVFEFQGQRLRVIEHNGEPWFIANEVCQALGIGNSRMALLRVSDHQKDDVRIADAIGRMQRTNIVSEGGLYKLTFQSRKPEAEAFTDHVVDVILPGIRKTGSYSLPHDHINEVHARIRDENMLLVEKLRFTVEEKANLLALSGILKKIGFAANAFLDNSLAKAFYPWCEGQGYDMSLVRPTKDARVVGYELKDDGITYNWDKPIKRHVNSYPEDPFGLAWSIFLVEYYWPEKFLPYLTYKYKGEERAQNITEGIKVISFFTGLTSQQITEKSKKKGK